MAARQGPWSPPSPPGVCELHLLSPPQGRAAWRPAWRGKARPPNPSLPAAYAPPLYPPARDDDGQRDDRVRRQGGDRTAIGGGSWGGAAGAGPIIVEEASMECSKSFIQALQELKNLPPQLYSASEYCEKSYLHSEQKQICPAPPKCMCFSGGQNQMSWADLLTGPSSPVKKGRCWCLGAKEENRRKPSPDL